MNGLRHVHESTGRWAAWADLVAGIVPLVEDPATGEPRTGREEEWSLVADSRVGLARHRRDHASILPLLQKRVSVNRRLAVTALTADPAALDDAQRNHLRTLAISLELLGTFQAGTGDPACLTALGEAKALHERLGLRREAAIVAFNLGHAYKDVRGVRDLDVSEAAYREGLALSNEGDRSLRAACHGQLGCVAWERFKDACRGGVADPEIVHRHLQAAVEGYHQQLALAPEEDHNVRGVAHNQLGVIFAMIGATDSAANHYFLSIRHDEASGNSYGAAQTRFNVADLYRKAQRFDDALAYARAARDGFARFEGRAAADVEDAERLIARIERKDATVDSLASVTNRRTAAWMSVWRRWCGWWRRGLSRGWGGRSSG